MPKFRKKPVVIEAVQWTSENLNEVVTFVVIDGHGSLQANDPEHFAAGEKALAIKTLEGVMCAEVGDWIIRGIKGEFYPCKPDIFVATYESVEG